MNKIAVPLLALALSGCSLAPELLRPWIESPTQWRLEVPAEEKAADQAWWEAFGDPVLSALIRDALTNGADLRIAAARVEQAAGALMQARSGYFPQLGYDLGAKRQRTGVADSTQPRSSSSVYQGSLGVSWEIDLFGRLRNASEAARSRLLASEEGRRATVLALTANVANGYLQLREFDRQLDIARATTVAQKESLRIFRLQYEAGVISQLQLNQAESQYEEAQAAVPGLENAIAQTENALSVLVGQPPGGISRGKSLLELTPPPIPAGLPSSLLARRPDLKQAEYSLLAANADIGVARANYFPSISLTGALGSLSAEAGKLFSGPARLWSYGGSLAGPLFSGGAVSGQVRQAEGARDEALARYQQAIQNAFADANDALSGVVKLREQATARQRQVTALQGYARLARLSYEAGNSPYLEVLNAEQSLFANQLKAAQAEGDALRAVVAVYAALGGAWVAEAEKLAPLPPGKTGTSGGR